MSKVYKYQQDLLLNKHPKYYKDLVERKPFEFKSGDVKPIAFYLPQFYAFEENNAWWGRGFTEWTNVTKASARFLGHYQPHLAGELGYYNLLTDGVIERQIELAQMYGIYGFCFYFYMFDERKRLLEKPLEKFIGNKSLNMPFCLCYANENWTKRWDGHDDDILMKQTYGDNFEYELALEMLSYIKDDRYIKINGKPLVIIYKVSILPDATNFSKKFRDICIELDIGEIYLCSVLHYGFTRDAREIGFDDNIEFPPHDVVESKINKSMEVFDSDFDGSIFSYPELVKYEVTKEINFSLFRSVMPNWDNYSRRPNGGSRIFHASTPYLYYKWLNYVCHKTIQERSVGERFVFINAWNEWAEGAHLEPDRRYGYAYLESTYNAIINCDSVPIFCETDFSDLDSQLVDEKRNKFYVKLLRYFKYKIRKLVK